MRYEDKMATSEDGADKAIKWQWHNLLGGHIDAGER